MVSRVDISDEEFRKLRIYNGVMGLLHAAQGVGVLLLSNDFSLPITAAFPEGPPGTPPPVPDTLFDLNIAWAVATFLFLSALFHLIVGVVMPGRYRSQLSRGQNQFRWIEYALSSSLMIVLIALLPGISNIAALLGLFGVNAAMIFFGMVMEIFNRPNAERVNWSPYLFGCVAGAVPWIAIGTALIGAQIESGGNVPMPGAERSMQA